MQTRWPIAADDCVISQVASVEDSKAVMPPDQLSPGLTF